jgi:hypothetical protein
MCWKRVVLDEAHTIKNDNTEVARACCLVQSERRWCLTGRCMYVFIWISMGIYVYMYIHLHIYICIYIHVCIHIYINVSVYPDIHISIYPHIY